MRSLILGGQKSGKSRHAESLMPDDGRPVSYIATARGNDEAMQARIEAHRARRPAHWRTVECEGELAAVLDRGDAPGACQLVDCLTLWLTGLLDDPERAATEQEALLGFLDRAVGDVVLVSNEVGLGVVPLGELSRRFVDEAGRLHQAVAARCDRVVFMAAGLPLYLKEPAHG